MTLPVVARANHDARLAETLEGTARKKEAAAGPGLRRAHIETRRTTPAGRAVVGLFANQQRKSSASARGVA